MIQKFLQKIQLNDSRVIKYLFEQCQTFLHLLLNFLFLVKPAQYISVKWMRLFSISLILILVFPVGATIDPVKIAGVLAKANAEITPKTSSAVNEGDFIVSGDSIFVNPDGTHYLFSFNFKRNTFQRLDHSTFHGHNFGRYLFEYKGDIFAFGGYGFWANHFKLIKFDHQTREWELILIKGSHIVGFQPTLAHKMGDSLYVFGTFDHHNPNEVDKSTSKQFIINLRNFTCTEMFENHNKVKNFTVKPYNYQFSDFRVWGSENSIDYIFDGKTGKYYRNASGPSFYAPSNIQKLQFKDSIFRFVIGDYYLSVLPNGQIEKTDLREYIKLFGVEENNIHLWEVSKENFFKKWKYQLYILLVVLFVAVLFGLWYFRKNGIMGRQKILDDYSGSIDIQDTGNQIAMLNNEVLSESEIDLLLRLSNMPKKFRKIKRSQLIFTINEQFPGLIEKIEQPLKKEFQYKISRKN